MYKATSALGARRQANGKLYEKVRGGRNVEFLLRKMSQNSFFSQSFHSNDYEKRIFDISR